MYRTILKEIAITCAALWLFGFILQLIALMIAFMISGDTLYSLPTVRLIFTDIFGGLTIVLGVILLLHWLYLRIRPSKRNQNDEKTK
jgi:hypothetical protein